MFVRLFDILSDGLHNLLFVGLFSCFIGDFFFICRLLDYLIISYLIVEMFDCRIV